jgi:hypothetical protein
MAMMMVAMATPSSTAGALLWRRYGGAGVRAATTAEPGTAASGETAASAAANTGPRRGGATGVRAATAAEPGAATATATTTTAAAGRGNTRCRCRCCCSAAVRRSLSEARGRHRHRQQQGHRGGATQNPKVDHRRLHLQDTAENPSRRRTFPSPRTICVQRACRTGTVRGMNGLRRFRDSRFRGTGSPKVASRVDRSTHAGLAGQSGRPVASEPSSILEPAKTS